MIFLFSIKNRIFVGLPNSLLVPPRFGRLCVANIAFKKFNASFVYVEEVHLFFKEIGHFFDWICKTLVEWSGHWSIKVEPWMSDFKFAQVWYQWVQIRKPTRHINTEVQVLNYQVYNQDVVSIRWTKVCQWAVSLSLREENAEGFATL